jgi:ribosomal protein L9
MKGVGTGMAEVKLHKEVTHKLKIVVAPATL